MTLALFCGCQTGNLSSTGTAYHPTRRTLSTELDFGRILAAAERDLETATELDEDGQACSVDAYYRAALASARVLEATTMAPHPYGEKAGPIYQASLSGLIDTAQRYCRLDPSGHLVIHDGRPRTIRISYHGFAWRPCDFGQVALADQFSSNQIANRYVNGGLGVSLVAFRPDTNLEEPFFRPKQPFGVTALLRPTRNYCETGFAFVEDLCGEESVLEFYNPHTQAAVEWGGATFRLAGDLTGPAAAIVTEAPRQYFRGFTAPADNDVKAKLIFTEPYQRGKIPIIFVHGLYSDPITWVDTVNELRSQGDLYRDYQFWVFRYPTGGEVLESAADLRQQLTYARHVCDPTHSDPALDQMVLVGHSLGGLVSKMQIVQSQDVLWRQVAMRPFDTLRAPPEARMRISRMFFFEPLPFVTRVVFVGAPFQGSSYATRFAGRVGSSLVSFGEEEDEKYRALMDVNPDVFPPEIARSRPTSVNLLEPTSPLLNGLRQTPIPPAIRLHTIIGTGGVSPVAPPGDGVVSVASARHPGVQSEYFVDAKHEQLHRNEASIGELARIMRLHAQEGMAKRPCLER